MSKYEKKCLRCKKEFITNRNNKIFCTRRCKERTNKNRHLRYRKEYCEECGFIPKDICQLDVDHVDGNHKNNEINNLKTLCSNCHRLKTKIERMNHDKKV